MRRTKTDRTEFQRIFVLQMKKACDRLNITQGDLAQRLGKSRGALVAIGQVKKACAFPFLDQFCQVCGIAGEARKELEREWIVDRLRFGKYGTAIGILIDFIRSRTTPREFTRLIDDVAAAYAAASSDGLLD